MNNITEPDGANHDVGAIHELPLLVCRKFRQTTLSEEFLLELKNKEHKNVALEVLKKLLNDAIKARAKKNLVQSRTLMEMLQEAIKRYHAKVLTAAEVMDELINISAGSSRPLRVSTVAGQAAEATDSLH